MGIGIKYDDGSGSLKPLASFRGMAGTPPMKGGIGTIFRGMAGTPPIRKSLSERMRERREMGKEASKSIKLDVADPRRQGKVVGAVAHHELDAENSHRGPTEHTPWERPFMSGIHFEEEASTGRIVVWAFLRSDKFTGEGRAFETTGETKVPVFSFYPGGETAAKLPWTFDTETGKWLRPFINLPTGRHAVESADGVEGRNYVKIAFSGSDPVVETDTIVSSDETDIDNDVYCFYVGTLAEDPNDQEKLIQTKGVYSEPVLMVYV